MKNKKILFIIWWIFLVILVWWISYFLFFKSKNEKPKAVVSQHKTKVKEKQSKEEKKEKEREGEMKEKSNVSIQKNEKKIWLSYKIKQEDIENVFNREIKKEKNKKIYLKKIKESYKIYYLPELYKILFINFINIKDSQLTWKEEKLVYSGNNLSWADFIDFYINKITEILWTNLLYSYELDEKNFLNYILNNYYAEYDLFSNLVDKWKIRWV